MSDPFTARPAQKRLCAIRPGEVREAARKYFRPDRLNLALVSPMKNAKRLEGLLNPQETGGTGPGEPFVSL